MSLIVAKVYGSSCFIVGDTKLTSNIGEKLGPTRGVMKIAIVNPTLCVGFAGNLYFANEALKTVRSLTSGDRAEVVRVLLNFHVESERQTDFIAAFALPNPILVEIKGGRADETANTWVGDQQAFAAFQERFHDPSLSERRDNRTHVSASLRVMKLPDQPDVDRTAFSRMKEAFSAVIDEQCSNTVGDFVAPAAIDFGKWRFFDYCDFLSHTIEWRKMVPPDGKEHLIHFGTPQEGGYAVNFMASDFASGFATALFFQQGRFGVLFKADDGGFPAALVVRPPISPVDFEDKLALDHKIHVKSMLSGASEYAKRGWESFRLNECEAALTDFNQAVTRAPNDAKIRFARASVLIQQGDLRLAQEDLNKAIEIDPTFPDSFHARGVANARLGNLEGAMRDFLRTLELDPQHAEATANLARVKRNLIKSSLL